MVEELTMGPCIAMELSMQNSVQSLRSICGPYDPDISRTIRKNTVRALFGNNIS